MREASATNRFANGRIKENRSKRHLNCVLLKWRLINTASSRTQQNEISSVINPNDTETSCTIDNNTPCVTIRRTPTKNVPCVQHCTRRSSNVSVSYKTTARSIRKMYTYQPHAYVEPSHVQQV